MLFRQKSPTGKRGFQNPLRPKLPKHSLSVFSHLVSAQIVPFRNKIIKGINSQFPGDNLETVLLCRGFQERPRWEKAPRGSENRDRPLAYLRMKSHPARPACPRRGVGASQLITSWKCGTPVGLFLGEYDFSAFQIVMQAFNPVTVQILPLIGSQELKKLEYRVPDFPKWRL